MKTLIVLCVLGMCSSGMALTTSDVVLCVKSHYDGVAPLPGLVRLNRAVTESLARKSLSEAQGRKIIAHIGSLGNSCKAIDRQALETSKVVEALR